jgi:two-component system, NarL family, response regulator NreC
MSIRVLIVDERASVRAGLALLVNAEDDLQAVGEAESAAQVVSGAVDREADVVVLDAALWAADGVDAIERLVRERPESRVVVVSVQDEPRQAGDAFERGASGYVLRQSVEADLVQAIREVAAGGRYVNPELGVRLIVAETAERRRAENPLSDREREVLRLLALGHTNQEIAGKLVISVRTAEAHRAHIMQKLRLSTRAELVRYAMDEGLLDT